MNVYFISYCVTIPPVNGGHEACGCSLNVFYTFGLISSVKKTVINNTNPD